MARRLTVRLGGRPVGFPLASGEILLGSGGECQIQLAEPTVSRRQAMLRVEGDGVELEDLGSRNGTFVNDRRISEPVVLSPADELRFGDVRAVVEEVAAAELELALPLPVAAPARRSGAETAGASTTLAAGAAEGFLRERLPRLLDGLAAGAGRAAMAQACGHALFEVLPCLRLEIASSADGEALLFSAAGERQPAEPEAPVRVAVGSLAASLWFLDARLAEPHLFLVEAALRLAEMADGLGGERPPVPSPASPPPLPQPPSVVGEVERLYAEAARVARGDVTVLIRGESGTGKEVLARYLHVASPRAEGPFVALNCAAMPRDLLEAELFGIEGGVATGVNERAGHFELARGGTLLLDEIGDMSTDTQAKILRVLQEGKVYRIGGRRARPADARILAATNQDLERAMEVGSFRRDLFHRIADWVVELPPLRDRRQDIGNLAIHFLARECRAQGVRPRGVSRQALGALLAYSWPGNIRQLEREMARAALFLADDGLLETRHLDPAIAAAAGSTPENRGTLKEAIDVAQRRAITAALAEAEGDTAVAARRLDVSRPTLYRRMRELGLRPDQKRSRDSQS